jgi:hypothetical protein
MVSGQLHAPASLLRWKRPRHPLNRKLGGLQSRSGRCEEEKSLASTGNWTPAAEPVARLYTDWAIPTPDGRRLTLWKNYSNGCMFEVLTGVVKKSSVILDLTPRYPMKVNWRFGRTSRCHFRVYSSAVKMDVACSSETSVDWFSTGYTVLQPRRQISTVRNVCFETAL